MSNIESPWKALSFPFDVSVSANLAKNYAYAPVPTSTPAPLPNRITIHGGLTTIIGPNGSGKTHLLRSLQGGVIGLPPSKRTRFISAGRIGMLEQYRVIVSGNSHPNYEAATFGRFEEIERRSLVETLESDYQNIAARPDIQLKIRERLRKLFKRDISFSWEHGQLKVRFSAASGGSKSYSAAREASGLLHLVGLLSAIYDDTTGVLLLDEPEVSLHPQLQAFLLREIVSVAGMPGERNKKIVILSTHSTEFLKVESPKDLCNFVFMNGVDEAPIQIDPNEPQLKSKQIAELISRMGQEHKLSFFAKSPLLVEGPSDTIICAGLSNKMNIHMEAGGSQILPVVGKGQFPAVLKLLRLMGKSPLVLADADAYIDDNSLVNMFANNDAANEAAVARSHAGLMKMHLTCSGDFNKLVGTDWSAIEDLAVKTWYWLNQDKDVEDKTKIRRRAAFSAMFSNDIHALSPSWRAMRISVGGFLDALEAAGCFILRKGTIESYYEHSSNSGGKPAAAAEEVVALKDKARAEVEEQFSDVLRCLNKAAETEDISEADIIQDAVISIAAPIVAKLREGNVSLDPNTQARSTGVPIAELFDLRIVDGKLVINLTSKILDISCFPMILDPVDDPITKISQLIKASGKNT